GIRRCSACAGRNKTARGAWPCPAAKPARPWPEDRACPGGRSGGSRRDGARRPRCRAKSFLAACQRPARRQTGRVVVCGAFSFPGRYCDWRVFRDSFLGRGVGFHLLEELVDSGRVLLGTVEREVEIGHAAKLQPLQNFVADEADSVFER